MSVISHPTYFTGLPREYYYSPEIYEQELERIFQRQWLFFCHVSEVPNPGDYLAREMAGEGVIVMRGSDDRVRAFLNVCRHRGAQLCPVGSGTARRARITCPYHQWTYDDQGRLLNAPSIPDDERTHYREWSLFEVQAETYQGLVFVCLGQEPIEPLSSLFSSMTEKFARTRPERMKLAHMVCNDMKANWKTGLENSECYHCSVGHPELSTVMDATGYDDVDFHWEKAWEYDVMDYPMRPGVQSITMDGRFGCTKLLGEFGDGDTPPADAAGFNTGMYIQPARTSVNVFADHVNIYAILPVSIDRSVWINWWYVRDDAVEGVDYDIEGLCSMSDITVRQDVALCELVQRGNRSRRYVPGPLSESQEIPVLSGLITYLTMMGHDEAAG